MPAASEPSRAAHPAAAWVLTTRGPVCSRLVLGPPGRVVGSEPSGCTVRAHRGKRVLRGHSWDPDVPKLMAEAWSPAWSYWGVVGLFGAGLAGGVWTTGGALGSRGPRLQPPGAQTPPRSPLPPRPQQRGHPTTEWTRSPKPFSFSLPLPSHGPQTQGPGTLNGEEGPSHLV